MYWIKMVLFRFIFINVKLNDQGYCSNLSTALVEYDDASDGKVDLPVVDFKNYKSNVMIVEDINAKGSANNKIELYNHVSNVEVYAILENDVIMFVFNVFGYEKCTSLLKNEICYFKVDFGKNIVNFEIENKHNGKILIDIINNGNDNDKGHIDMQSTDNFIVKIYKNGTMTIENDPKRYVPSLKELETIPTKDGREAVHVKFDGSGLKEASVKNLHFKTKVGKVFEEAPETGIKAIIHNTSNVISLVSIVLSVVVAVLVVTICVCANCSDCPLYERIRGKPRNAEPTVYSPAPNMNQNQGNQAGVHVQNVCNPTPGQSPAVSPNNVVQNVNPRPPTPVTHRPPVVKVSAVRDADGKGVKSKKLTVKIPVPVKEKKGIVGWLSKIKTDKTQLGTEEIFQIDDQLHGDFRKAQKKLDDLELRSKNCHDNDEKKILKDEMAVQNKIVDELLTNMANHILEYWSTHLHSRPKKELTSTEDVKNLIKKSLDSTQKKHRDTA